MTAKRFTIEKKGGMFYIFDTGSLIPISDGQPICDLLNELAEENIKIKKNCNRTHKDYAELINCVEDLGYIITVRNEKIRLEKKQ